MVLWKIVLDSLNFIVSVHLIVGDLREKTHVIYMFRVRLHNKSVWARNVYADDRKKINIPMYTLNYITFDIVLDHIVWKTNDKSQIDINSSSHSRNEESRNTFLHCRLNSNNLIWKKTAWSSRASSSDVRAHSVVGNDTNKMASACRPANGR